MTRDLAEARRALAPEVEEAFRAFSQKVFADGALSAKTKQLIAVAVAHVTQCPYCIKGHTRPPHGRHARGDHGGDLGGGRDAGRWGGAHATLALAELGVGKTTEDGPGPG